MNKKMIVGMAVAAMSLMGNKAYAQFDFGKILQNGADILSNGGTTDDLLSGITSIFSDKKVATIDDLVGEWAYTEPAVVFMSENLLKKAGGKLASSAIEKTIETQLNKVGITKGAMKMTFTRNGRFTQTIAGRRLRGTFTIKGKEVVLKYAGEIKQLVGTTQVDGNDLLIVMDASKMLTYLKAIGSISGNASLKTATSLLGSMDGMLCGLRLNRASK
ncbi:MAG: lipocalin-like domain-containing protein [Prevotella sp.]